MTRACSTAKWPFIIKILGHVYCNGTSSNFTQLGVADLSTILKLNISLVETIPGHNYELTHFNPFNRKFSKVEPCCPKLEPYT